MKQLLILLPLLLSVTLHAQPTTPGHHTGDSLYKAGSYEQAIEQYKKELKKDPKNAVLLRNIGHSFISKNQSDSGEKYYLQALTIDNKCANCYLNLAYIYSEKNDYVKALEILSKGIQVSPDSAAFYMERGKIRHNYKLDEQRVFADFNKGIELEPNNPAYYLLRGSSYAKRGNFLSALADLNKAIQLDSTNSSTYENRAGVYYDQKMFSDALNDINKAIELDGTQHTFYYKRGGLYTTLNEHQKAIKDFDKTIELNPDNPMAYYYRSSSKRYLEDIEGFCADATYSYTLFLKANPNNPVLQEMAPSILEFCDSSQISYYYQRGIVYYNIGEYEKAVAICNAGLKKMPGHTLILMFRGDAYKALGQHQQALSDYILVVNNEKKLLEDIKKNHTYENASPEELQFEFKNFMSSTLSSMAQCEFNLEWYERALPHISKAIEILPAGTTQRRDLDYHVRGNVYLELSKFEYAIADFTQCIQLNPQFHAAYSNRAVAKMNLSEPTLLKTFSLRGSMSNKVSNSTWSLPVKTSKKTDPLLLSALEDCNKAIELEPQAYHAYYVRARIKQMLLINYCSDLLKAKELGYAVEVQLLKNCPK